MDSFVAHPFMCLIRRVQVSPTPHVSIQRFLFIPETHVFRSLVRNNVQWVESCQAILFIEYADIGNSVI